MANISKNILFKIYYNHDISFTMVGLKFCFIYQKVYHQWRVGTWQEDVALYFHYFGAEAILILVSSFFNNKHFTGSWIVECAMTRHMIIEFLRIIDKTSCSCCFCRVNHILLLMCLQIRLWGENTPMPFDRFFWGKLNILQSFLNLNCNLSEKIQHDR